MIIMSFPQVCGYNVLEKVGVGSYSVVYKAQKKVNKNEIVAIKCLDKRLQRTSFGDRVVQEISMLKMLKHEYIVNLIDFMWDTKYIFIITEFCDEGDLSQYIRKKYKLSEALVKMFMQQLALALKYLNNYNICHMDLKPQNLLLSSKPKLKLKMADFGLSQIISPENAEQFRYAGSLLYMAPEKILNESYDSRVDLWSIGIIMYECLFGRTPFTNTSRKSILDFMNKQTPIEFPEHTRNISNECADLLTRLLKYSPNERIGFEEFYKHPFLDLIHVPSAENYLTSVKLIQEAIELDKKKQYNLALLKYKEAIKILEVFIPAETDINQKAMLELRFNEYVKRAKAIETLVPGSSSDCQMLPPPSHLFDTLYEMSAMTPNLMTGLDIGTAGEMYLAEGKKNIALEKLTMALEMLIPLLEKEPLGARKDMLHSQSSRDPIVRRYRTHLPHKINNEDVTYLCKHFVDKVHYVLKLPLVDSEMVTYG